MVKAKVKTIDLFAGIGGIRMGFDNAFGGTDTVFVSEWDEWAARTYRENFGEEPPVSGDITQIAAEDIPPFDICLAGFPCQAFSFAGHHTYVHRPVKWQYFANPRIASPGVGFPHLRAWTASVSSNWACRPKCRMLNAIRSQTRGYRVTPARSAILSGAGSVAGPARGGRSKDAPGRSFNAIHAPRGRLRMRRTRAALRTASLRLRRGRLWLRAAKRPPARAAPAGPWPTSSGRAR